MKKLQHIKIFEDLWDGIPGGLPEILSSMSGDEFRKLFEKTFYRMLKQGNLTIKDDARNVTYLHVDDRGSVFEIYVTHRKPRGTGMPLMTMIKVDLNKKNLNVHYIVKYESAGRLKPLEYYFGNDQDGLFILTEDDGFVRSIEELVKMIDLYMNYSVDHEQAFEFEYRMNRRKAEYYKKHRSFPDNGFEYYRDR
jgi:hypothetical protein